MNGKKAGTRETYPLECCSSTGNTQRPHRRSRGDIVLQVLKQPLSRDAVVILHVVERNLFNQIAREVTRLSQEAADLRGERRTTATAEIGSILRSLLSSRIALRARTTSFLMRSRRVACVLPALVRRSGLRLGSP